MCPPLILLSSYPSPPPPSTSLQSLSHQKKIKKKKKKNPKKKKKTYPKMGIRGLIIFTFFLISLSFIVYSAYLNHNADCSFSLPSTSTTFTNTVTKITNNATTINLQEEEEEARVEDQAETNISHIVFGIAATSKYWDTRKEYIKQWWRPKSTRGIVWLDRKVRTYRNESLPEIRISSDTSRFPYKHKHGSRSALRISRIVSETLRLRLGNVRWLVMGDDDTVFVVDNVVRLLKGLDHRGFYYIGSSSESHIQNLLFSYNMAYGGAGFAISYALAVELEKMQDGCMGRYAGLYGSDDRIHACMAELGVPLMKHPGFHQVRLRYLVAFSDFDPPYCQKVTERSLCTIKK